MSSDHSHRDGKHGRSTWGSLQCSDLSMTKNHQRHFSAVSVFVPIFLKPAWSSAWISTSEAFLYTSVVASSYILEKMSKIWSIKCWTIVIVNGIRVFSIVTNVIICKLPRYVTIKVCNILISLKKKNKQRYSYNKICYRKHLTDINHQSPSDAF